MFRFFVEKKVNEGFLLSPETIKHLKVVRTENENFICVFEGAFYECELAGNHAKIIRQINENHEFAAEVVIAAAIIETKNWELMIQKAVELGVTCIIPIYSQNVSKKIFDLDAKIARWNKITKSAAEQAFRNVHPTVTMPLTFAEVVNLDFGHKFIAHEKTNVKVKESFPQDVLFLVGPEGGFDENEVELAIRKGFEVISLGKRILRAETASLFVLAKVI